MKYTPFVKAGSQICDIPYTLIRVKNYEGKTLLVRRLKPPYPGHWNFLGGKIDAGESAKISALRELHEETGINRKCKSLNFCGISLWPAANSDRFMGMYMFKTSVRSRKRNYSQMSMDDEGIYDWLDLHNYSATDLVPNAKVLDIAFTQGTSSNPIVLVHQINDDQVCEYQMFSIATSYNHICDKVQGSNRVQLGALVR